MDTALWAAKTGLDAQHTRLTVISNNIANINTTGYKRGRVAFEDLLYQNVRQAGAQSSQQTELPSGLYLGTGVRVVATEKLFTQGSLEQTGNPLDLAITGRGFFQILLPDGSLAYTRDGGFQMNKDGELVNSSGYQLQPGITVPGDALSVTIGRDGVVSVTQPGQTSSVQVGSLQLYDFVNATGLEPRGENLLVETTSSGAPTSGTPGTNGLGILVQSSLETSNVNVVEELVGMIETQRAYEINSKAISTADEMLSYLTNSL
ncbi:MAG: flagellar basal-body rod protein FlgG [Gammaproteobacteria bacterium]|jgi:flagellar basal-body rod protein FlgG|nr:flagellar basal-body rod protein FlgG [Gammaproteobacteria bacterium]MDH4310674.1 flagellar basal-body rod protein FlgG [Gammaproteobacteria bacterium]MDH5272373.1 flagellar basal-body rod protein FlgG [Gammaproteobacteria bacterium]